MPLYSILHSLCLRVSVDINNMEGILKEVNAAKYRLEEIMRTARLEVIKGYKDYELSLENVRMYSELLRGESQL